MAKYNIDPAVVTSTLRATADSAEGFEDDLKPLNGHVSNAASSCNSAAIGGALEGLFTREGAVLRGMANRVEACLTGAAAARNAYLMGDQEMVLTYQKNASAGKTSKIPR